MRRLELFQPVNNRKVIIGQFIFFLFWLGVNGFAIYLNPSPYGHGTHQELGLPPCPSVLLFNRPCPGCGLTTSFTAFIHGDFSQSFHAHPLGPFLYLTFSLFAILAMYGFVKKLRLNMSYKWVSKPLVAFGIIFILFGIARFALVTNYQTPYEKVYASHVELR